MLVLFGYNASAKLLTLDQLLTQPTIANLHPEFLKRVLALVDASEGRVGIGEGWRSRAAQLAEFLRRHVVDPNGTIVFEGKRWSLKPGMAPLAPPDDRSYHLATIDGKAVAADLTGDLDWSNAHCHEFALRDFSHVGAKPEKWHHQPIELPTARADYNAHPERYPLQSWGAPSLPTEPPPAQEDDDMATAFIGVEGADGQFLWTPGSEPIAFTNPHDRDELLKALKIDPNNGGTISPEMFARLR